MFSDPTGKFSVWEHYYLLYTAYKQVLGADHIKTRAIGQFSLIYNGIIDVVGMGNKDFHLDNYTPAKFQKLFSNGGYYNLPTHALGDFYCHTNYIEIMIELGYNQDNMPIFDELDDDTRSKVMTKIRGTNNNVKIGGSVKLLGLFRICEDDNNEFDHDATDQFYQKLKDLGIPKPGNSKYFSSKHKHGDDEHLYYRLALKLTLNALKNQISRDNNIEWIEANALAPKHKKGDTRYETEDKSFAK